MSDADYATYATELTASGGTTPSVQVTADNFTTTDGTALGAGDALVVRSVVADQTVTLDRAVDPDTDGTFEISVRLDTLSGASERSSDALLVRDDVALTITNTTGSSAEVVLVAQVVPRAQTFVEAVTGLADGNTLVRQTSARGQSEHVLELLGTGSALVRRQFDRDDDGTAELDAAVHEVGQGSYTDLWLATVDVAGRTNTAGGTALENNSGAANDYALIGTIGDVE